MRKNLFIAIHTAGVIELQLFLEQHLNGLLGWSIKILINSLRELAKKAVTKTKFYPDWGQKRLNL